jgi:GMP synthase-like glutamine amidotransferase
MAMSVLVFRHVPFEGLGRIADVLDARGIGYDYADLFENPDAPLDVTRYGGLIFMGGPMSVNDDLPWLARERRYITEAVKRGQPLLGICLGAQLIANALGARVFPNPVKEIGWFDVEFAPESTGDPLLACAARVETVFHWHGETFELPSDAALLARSARCKHQAFRLGRTVYGFQFHLEVTPEMIAGWCAEDANCGDVRELAQPLDPNLNAERLKQLSHGVFDAWCDLLP